MNPEATGTPRTDEAALQPRDDSRPRIRRLVLVLVITGFLAVVALAALDATRVASELRAGRAQLRSLSRSPASFAAEGSARVAAAARRFSLARERAAQSPWLGLVSRLGYAGRPARWVRHASEAAALLGRRASEAVARIDARLAGGAKGGAGRLELLAAVETEFADLAGAARRVRVPDPGWIYPPARGSHGALLAAIEDLGKALDDGRIAMQGVRSFLAGPSRYLILAGNNAEMRAGGMVLQAGIIRAEGGVVRPTGFATTSELLLPTSVPVPPEIAGLYGWLQPGREWRNTTSSPNFPVVAPMYAAMTEAVGIGAVDGVLFLDVVGLRALLDAVGVIEIEGVRYDATNVERLVLHDLYVRFDGVTRERRMEYARLAGETFRSLDRPEVDARKLAAGLAEAVAGRHLLAWSRRQSEQDAWRRLNADGALDRDGLMVTVQNHSGNKLDWFVRPDVAVTVTERPGGWKRVRLKVEIRNTPPDGEPEYVIGNGVFTPVGVYRTLVAVYLPGWAANVEIAPGAPALVGPDGPMRVIGVRFDVPRGGATTVDVSFSVPPGHDRLVLLPSGRAAPIRYRFGEVAFNDARRRTVPI